MRRVPALPWAAQPTNTGCWRAASLDHPARATSSGWPPRRLIWFQLVRRQRFGGVDSPPGRATERVLRVLADFFACSSPTWVASIEMLETDHDQVCAETRGGSQARDRMAGSGWVGHTIQAPLVLCRAEQCVDARHHRRCSQTTSSPSALETLALSLHRTCKIECRVVSAGPLHAQVATRTPRSQDRRFSF